MLPDRIKMLLPAVIVIGCLLTMFTSPSIVMSNSDMATLSPPVNRLCKKALSAKASCGTSQKEHGQTCRDTELAASKCDRAVRRAYQHINFGGCPFEIKAVTLCRAEWCLVPDGACQRECAGVREQLDQCVGRHIRNFLKRSGLQEDGTLAK